MSDALRDTGRSGDTSFDTLDMTDTLARYHRAAKELARVGLLQEAQDELNLAKKYLNGDGVQHALFHYNRARLYAQADELWSAQQALAEGLEALGPDDAPGLAEELRNQYVILEAKRLAEAAWPVLERSPVSAVTVPWVGPAHEIQ